MTGLPLSCMQALQHLEMQLINVACDDPGAAIGANMALPLLQDRLDACARKYAEERALEAQEALFLTEVRVLHVHWEAQRGIRGRERS